MSQEKLPITTNLDSIDLKIQLEQLQKEFAAVTQKVTEFETLLYRHLGDEILEVQELTVIYKELKRAKKQQRQLQKQRGKNYVAPTGLNVVEKATPKTAIKEDSQEKKRLYREAMFHVHPDKFSLQATETELATEVTTKLIQIYKEGDLKALQAYHAHIFSDTSLRSLAGNANVKLQANSQVHLLAEIETIKEQLHQIKRKSTYTVLMTYKNPYTFVDELKLYYKDRIAKLKKRTRKAFK
ncbi:hypothetical protein [Kordia jejudonensis]|uniref:hypothetical protein n=1 Tax=Kordia jejudonensis TaxID=1348245 RepID=UPI000629AD55|nr:hypothetical protein [Kordia jejudonensis]